MPLAQIIALVDDKLRSAALGSAANMATRDRAIEQAVVQYSEDAPRVLVQDVAGVNTQSISVPEGWVAERSRLVRVEHPIGTLPESTLPATAVFDGAVWRVLFESALANALVRVHFTTPHELSDALCTIPPQHENAVASWAAAELCRQLATQRGHDRDATIGAAASLGQSASGDLARRAREWLAVYRVALGLPDPDKEPGARAAGAVVAFASDRRRGRFNSLEA